MNHSQPSIAGSRLMTSVMHFCVGIITGIVVAVFLYAKSLSVAKPTALEYGVCPMHS